MPGMAVALCTTDRSDPRTNPWENRAGAQFPFRAMLSGPKMRWAPRMNSAVGSTT